MNGPNIQHHKLTKSYLCKKCILTYFSINVDIRLDDTVYFLFYCQAVKRVCSAEAKSDDKYAHMCSMSKRKFNNFNDFVNRSLSSRNNCSYSEEL